MNEELWFTDESRRLLHFDEKTISLYKRIVQEILKDSELYKDRIEGGLKCGFEGSNSNQQPKRVSKVKLSEMSVNTVINNAGGDCLFYALNGNNNEDEALKLRKSLSQYNIAIPIEELTGLFAQTAVLTKYSHRLHGLKKQNISVEKIYNYVINIRGVWGGRIEIVNFAKFKKVNICVLESDGDVIKQLTMYKQTGISTERDVNINEINKCMKSADLILVLKNNVHWEQLVAP